MHVKEECNTSGEIFCLKESWKIDPNWLESSLLGANNDILLFLEKL